MMKLNKTLMTAAIATVLSVASLTVGTASASSSAYVSAEAKINHLESSFEKNYLGSKNLPTFRKYLSDAKVLTAKVTSASDRKNLDDRIAECEEVIVATENVVNMEASMNKNYRGMKNVPAFQAYVDKINASLIHIDNKTIHKKLSERSYAGNNVIRDIKVVDSEPYKMASKLLGEAICLINEGNMTGAKSKASEGLEFAFKSQTSLAKDAIVSELKSIQSM